VVADVNLIAAGVSHRTAPLEIREKLVYRPQDALDALNELRTAKSIHEGVILSTCNRTELYCAR
jgi:Glutamyl-tRNA reductase